MADVLEIIITLKDKATGELKKVTKDVRQFGDETEKTGKKTQSFGEKVLNNWAKIVALSGTVVAAGIAIKKAFDFAAAGAMIEQTTQSFDGLLEKVGIAPNLLDELREASRGTIDDVSLMSSTMALVAGSSDEMTRTMLEAAPRILEIAKAANKLNPALGTTSHMYQSLMTGIKRGSPLLIDNTGLTLKVGDANERLAKQLGKSVDELTAEEKTMALLNATMEAGGKIIDQVGGNVDSVTDSYAQLEVSIKNASDAIKRDWAQAVTPAIESYVSWQEAAELAEEAIAAGIITQMRWGEMQRDATFTSYTYADAIGEISNAFAEHAIQVEYAESAYIRANWASEEFRQALARTEWDKYRKEAQKTANTIEKELEPALDDASAAADELKNSMDTSLSDIRSNLNLTADEFEKKTQEIIFSMLQQKLAMDGFTQEEIGFLQDLAAEWGMIDSTALIAMEGVNEAMRLFNEGDINGAIALAEDLKNRLLSIPRYIRTDIEVHTSLTGPQKGYGGWQDEPRQHGGPVIGGKPYLVGEVGPELFMPTQSGQIIPNDQIMMGEQIVNNWNLTINEAGTRGSVIQDFALMKALAGV